MNPANDVLLWVLLVVGVVFIGGSVLDYVIELWSQLKHTGGMGDYPDDSRK